MPFSSPQQERYMFAKHPATRPLLGICWPNSYGATEGQ